ncbi:RNA polymerase sigma factor [Novosphingobium guangzhouense]|nr:RNA polymerase sigma factor [Novosphingobium guangzhouense]
MSVMAGEGHATTDAGQEFEDRGDDVIVRLYREETRWLVRYFHRNSVPHAEADELAQETFFRFLRSGTAKMLTTPQAYLRRIATNLLRDRADLSSTRVDNLKSPLSDAEDLPTPFDPLRILTARDDIAFCEQLLEALDPFDRELFLLNRVEGYSFREIGRLKGLNEWAVKRKIFKVLDHLLDRMESR